MRRILILDDEPAVLAALYRTLRTAFPDEVVEIETFDEPEAALLRASDQEFDVVISDYRMPGLSGADVLQMVKGLQPNAVRIVVSASTESGDILDALNRAEVFRFLPKPWERDELVAIVRCAFARRDALALPTTAAAPAGAALDGHERALRELELQEPGITHVDWDEHGNVCLFQR